MPHHYESMDTDELVQEYNETENRLEDIAEEILKRINDDEYKVDYDDFENNGDKFILVVERL